MDNHLRLADRQGLLQGQHISEVQTYALVVLNYLDAIEREKSRRDQMMFGLVSRADFDPEQMFPEYLRPRVTGSANDPEDSDETEYDYSHVEWKGGEEAEKEMADLFKLLENAQGRVGGEQAMTQMQRMREGDEDWV